MATPSLKMPAMRKAKSADCDQLNSADSTPKPTKAKSSVAKSTSRTSKSAAKSSSQPVDHSDESISPRSDQEDTTRAPRTKRCKVCKYTKLETILDHEVSYCTRCIDRFFVAPLSKRSPTCSFLMGCNEFSMTVRGHSVGFCMHHIELIAKYTTKKQRYFFPHKIELIETRKTDQCAYVYKDARLGFDKGSMCLMKPVAQGAISKIHHLCTYHFIEFNAVQTMIDLVHDFFSWQPKLDAADDGSKAELGFEGPTYKGELAAQKVLEDRYGVKFIKTRELPFLRAASVGKRNLEIDLYNDDLKLGVEVQGEQHYKESKSYKADLATQQENDRRKMDLCTDNGVYLIQLPWSTDWRGMQDELNTELDVFEKKHPDRILALRIKKTKI